VASGCGGDASTRPPQLSATESRAEPAADIGGARAEERCDWLLPPANTLQGSALNILSSFCGACHSPTAATPSAIGPADVVDIEGMIAEGYIVDCSADSSEIVRLMRSNEMPPPDYFGIGVTAPDLDQITRYIEFMCSAEEKACAVAPTDSGCAAVLAAREDRRCRR